MRRRSALHLLRPFLLFLVVLPGQWAKPPAVQALPYSVRLTARDEALEMLRHSFDSYMAHAFPWDELRPLSCDGRRWDRRQRGTLDDALGGFSLTLIDSLSSLALARDGERFTTAVRHVIEGVHFDRDVRVSVFETTIRVLGGLLSAHLLLLSFPNLYRHPVPYAGELLRLAVDLGERLLRAFETPTGVPVHLVHLQRGVEAGEARSTCPAAGGTLVVELGLLSRLTGDPRFLTAARRAVLALWQRRSRLGLLGSAFSVDDGRWGHTHTSIGAGIDSFFEYLHKGAVLLEDEELGRAFEVAYAAAEAHTRWRDVHVEVCMASGKVRAHRVSALQAFWPALQVQAGHIEDAKRTHEALVQIWRRFRALPELFDVKSGATLHFSRDSPLRPELLESTFHLYVATQDPAYLSAGRDMLFALQNISRVDCGFASIADVNTHRLDDRMDSYFISETLKYLFLLFDESLEPSDRRSLLCARGDNSTLHRPLPVRDERSLSRASNASSSSSPFSSPISSTAPLPPFPDNCLPPDSFIFTTEGHPVILRHSSFSSSSSSTSTTTPDSCRSSSAMPLGTPMMPKACAATHFRPSNSP